MKHQTIISISSQASTIGLQNSYSNKAPMKEKERRQDDASGAHRYHQLVSSHSTTDSATFHREIQMLSNHNRQCYENLNKRWRQSNPKFNYPDEMYLRFARQTVDSITGDFCEEDAWTAMNRFRERYLNLSVHRLEQQLSTKTLFPVSSLKTKRGHDVFYMKPSRYFPNTTRTKTIIDNLAYVMNCMLEKQSASKDGIAFVACMDDWKMKNFDVQYCYKFMMTLQGHTVPVRVQLFLIVNPPSWFHKIWRIMKPMLAPGFRNKVKMIKEDQLSVYLQPGYGELLPDDMKTGQADTDEIVRNFIQQRKKVEPYRGYQDHSASTDWETEKGDDEGEDEGEYPLSLSEMEDACGADNIDCIITGADGSDPLGIEDDVLGFWR